MRSFNAGYVYMLILAYGISYILFFLMSIVKELTLAGNDDVKGGSQMNNFTPE